MNKPAIVIRRDRIQGATSRAINIRNLISLPIRYKKELDSYRRMYIDHYIMNGLRVNGVLVSFKALSQALNMQPLELIAYINKAGKAMIRDTEGAYLSFMAHAAQMALADRHEAEEQLGTLKVAQGSQYQPFISSTVNDAIRGLMTSTKGILEIARAFKGTGPSIAIQQNANPINQLNQHYISTQEAMKLIEAKQGPGLLNDTNKQQLLIGTYEDQNLPEVVAFKQQGFSMKAEGEIMAPKAKKVKKEDRREVEGEIISE